MTDLNCSIFLACLEGFEPPTYWFVASHSIQLSYKHLSEMSLKKDIHNAIYFITFLAKSQDAYLKSSKCTKYRLINITKIKITAKIRLCLDKNIFFCYNYICFETLAQSVEHTPFKRRVEGSNPSCLTKKMEQFRPVSEKVRCFGLFFVV